MDKEMIEDAASEHACSEYDPCARQDKVTEGDLWVQSGKSFEFGANWAIEQMSNDAIKFAVWLHNNQFIRYIQSADGDVPYGSNKNFKGCIWVSTKIQYLSEFYNAHELYQLYLNSKTK